MFPQLGTAITLALARVQRLVRRAARGFERGDPTPVAQAHLDGRRVALATTGALLGALARLTPAAARRWRRGSMAYAERSLELTRVVIGTGMTRAELERYAALVLRQSVWAGQDTEARTIAEDHDAQFKEWVRAFPPFRPS